MIILFRIIVFILLTFPLLLISDDNFKYTLSTGDRIKIQVYGEDDLTLEIKLDDDGIISYPFLGDILVKGLSMGELENKIKNGLQDGYLRQPNVNVSILQYRPFYINGEVRKPGAYPFEPGLKVQQAISTAGGFTERASEKKIYVIHPERNKKVKITKDSYVQPGDIITVDESFF